MTYGSDYFITYNHKDKKKLLKKAYRSMLLIWTLK